MDKKCYIEKLVEQLNEANHKYYVLNEPIMSDYDFDMQLKELEKLENEENYILPYSPTQRIGSDLQDDFRTVTRNKVMGSIQNCYDMEELKKWMSQFDPISTTFLLEPKYDGTSCSLIYENGILVQASTRGDGYNGADITANVKTIKNIPLKIAINQTSVTNDWHYNDLYIPERVEIRGEILMPKSVFARLNVERVSAGEQPFANERNAAAGSIKQLDPKITASRQLSFKPYGLFTSDADFNEHYLKTQHSMLDIAHIYGFDEPMYIQCVDAYTVMSMIGWFENNYLHDQDYCMDGCVIKIDDVNKQDELGYTQKVPRWAKAFKFKQEVASTKLTGIELQMGMSGQISFVAKLEPVEVDGSVIKKATLNNMDYIRNMDIYIGDYVFVQKNGAVIPGVTGIDYEMNAQENVHRVVFEEPVVCPFCGELLVRKNGGVHLYCKNKNCPELMLQKLNHFVSKDCLNIEGLSLKTIQKMNSSGVLVCWQQLYSLTVDKIVSAGIGEKVAVKLIDQIVQSKNADQSKVLYAIGIPMIGKVTAKILIKHFHNLYNILNATLEEIAAVGGVGEVAAKELFDYCIENRSEIMFAMTIFVADKNVNVRKTAITGKKIMATGKLQNFTRDSIVESVEKNGGIYSSSVSSNLDYLIVGEKAGANKLEKAMKCGIEIIDEKKYLQLIGQ